LAIFDAFYLTIALHSARLAGQRVEWSNSLSFSITD